MDIRIAEEKLNRFMFSKYTYDFADLPTDICEIKNDIIKTIDGKSYKVIEDAEPYKIRIEEIVTV